MPKTPPPQIVELTPPGRGAVATLRVEGPRTVEMVQEHFQAASGRRLASLPCGRLVVGRFDSDPGEEVVVRRHDDAVEVHCHGGRAAVERIERTLVAGGAKAVAWQDWLAGRHDDPIVAAALVALADARTERTAAILLDQYHGALRRALEEIKRHVAEGDLAAAREKAAVLAVRVDLGRHLVEPWQVVVVGRANVGKSSLVNAMVGYSRAIVHRTPGTTRDVVRVRTAIDGWPVELSDTAGLQPTDDRTERAGIRLTHQKLAEADLAVLVFDAANAFTAEDRAWLERWPEALVVHNKVDLPPDAGPRPPGIGLSARSGKGVDDLLRAIASRLVPEPPPAGAAVPFVDGQLASIASILPIPPAFPAR